MTSGQTPAQTIGPFWHHALLQYAPDDLDPHRHAGNPIILHGQVTDGTGAVVDDAMIEFWQADGHGRYRHPADPAAGDVPDGFVGFGRVATDDDGRYRIRTIVPGSVRSATGDSQTDLSGTHHPQAPHLNVQVFARGLLRLLATRAYLPDPGPDPVLDALAGDRRHTVIATPEGDDGGVPVLRFDIVLQGPDETVFFDY